MHEIIAEYNVGFKDYFILKLNEKIPNRHFEKYRIGGKEYEYEYLHIRAPLEVQLRYICIKAPEGGSFVGKEVEFV